MTLDVYMIKDIELYMIKIGDYRIKNRHEIYCNYYALFLVVVTL